MNSGGKRRVGLGPVPGRFLTDKCGQSLALAGCQPSPPWLNFDTFGDPKCLASYVQTFNFNESYSHEEATPKKLICSV